MALLPTSIPPNMSNDTMHGNQNNTTGVICGYDDPRIYTVIPVYILCITVLGIIFNAFVLAVLCLHRKTCTVAEIYLGNLAAADLLLVSFLPFWAYNVSQGFNWPFNLTLCKLVNGALAINAYSSIYFLVLISGDRYLALVHPLSHEALRRPHHAKLGCLLVWVLALVLSSPIIIYRTVERDYQGNGSTCRTNIPHYFPYEVSISILTFIIPMVIITFFTIKILKVLSNRQITGINLNNKKQELKATTLVLAVLLAFVVCWVPYHTVKVLLVLHHLDVLTGCDFTFNIAICLLVFTYFAFFNSVLNPILYVIVGKNFRKKARDLFKKLRNTENTTTFSLTSTHTNMSRNVHTEDPSK